MRRHCVLNVQCLHDGLLFLLFWLDVYFAQVKQCTYICLFTTPHPLSLSHTHTCKHSESHDSLFSSIHHHHHHQYSILLFLLSSIKTVIFRYFITLSCARHAAINLTNLSKCLSYFLQCFVPLCVCVCVFTQKLLLLPSGSFARLNDLLHSYSLGLFVLLLLLLFLFTDAFVFRKSFASSDVCKHATATKTTPTRLNK